MDVVKKLIKEIREGDGYVELAAPDETIRCLVSSRVLDYSDEVYATIDEILLTIYHLAITSFVSSDRETEELPGFLTEVFGDLEIVDF